mgnify:CR=1 FL=1
MILDHAENTNPIKCAYSGIIAGLEDREKRMTSYFR